MNANGDERIDPDEFVGFFLNLLMGTIDQRMQIAFRCYDVDNDQSIDSDEMRIMLVNIPFKTEYEPCRNSIQETASKNIKTSELVEQ